MQVFLSALVLCAVAWGAFAFGAVEVTVGESRRPMPIHVRTVASCDTGWDAAVEDARMRDDLATRLAGHRVGGEVRRLFDSRAAWSLE